MKSSRPNLGKTKLVEATGLGTVDVPKQLQLLHAAGFVARRKEALHARLILADEDVFLLHDTVRDGPHGSKRAPRRLWNNLCLASHEASQTKASSLLLHPTNPRNHTWTPRPSPMA